MFSVSTVIKQKLHFLHQKQSAAQCCSKVRGHSPNNKKNSLPLIWSSSSHGPAVKLKSSSYHINIYEHLHTNTHTHKSSFSSSFCLDNCWKMGKRLFKKKQNPSQWADYLSDTHTPIHTHTVSTHSHCSRRRKCGNMKWCSTLQIFTLTFCSFHSLKMETKLNTLQAASCQWSC